MQRFEFTLERVRELWRRQADLEEIRMKELFGKLRALDQQQERIESERAEADQSLRRASGVEAWELEALASFRRYSEQQKRLVAQRQAECREAIWKQQQVLVEARRRTRLMDKLKERKLAEWKHKFARELEEIAAESFMARFARERN